MKKTRKGWIYGAAAAALLLATAGAEEVAVPPVINYQGRLTNPSDGRPIEPGAYEVAFRVWDHPTATDPSHLVWGRVFAVHVVTNGLFNVLISDDGAEVTAPAPREHDLRQAFQGEFRYLGLTVIHGPGGPISAPEITPRQRLVSAPFAFHAANATEAFHAQQADEARSAQDSARLGGKEAALYYDEDRFKAAVGELSTAARVLAWDEDGKATGLDLYAFSGNLSLGTAAAPPAGVRLQVSGGKIQADDGVLVSSGAVTPSVGSTSNDGIRFPFNPGGGAGDFAQVHYYPRSGESCTLAVEIGNDGDDNLLLKASGDVQLATEYGTVTALDANSVNLLSKAQTGLVWNKWYRAETDGFAVLWLYHGAATFSVKDRNGTLLIDSKPLYFKAGWSDTAVVSIPLAEGDEILLVPRSDAMPQEYVFYFKPMGRSGVR